jgi:uncharacterized protein (UPF0332 family)
MNGREFLNTARHLASRGNEADGRSSVSRAYYAVFHAARDLLTAQRFRVPRADRAHKYLYFRLNNCGDSRVENAAILLDNLRSLRNEADYDVRRPWIANAVPDAIADAQNVLQVLDALAPAELIQITDAMKLYEQSIGDVTWQP